jgi:hypothetical protein
MIERTEPRATDAARISWIRRHGWQPAVMGRAIAALSAGPKVAPEDARLGAELIRWLDRALRDHVEAAAVCIEVGCEQREVKHSDGPLASFMHPFDWWDAPLPPVPPEMESLAAILSQPAVTTPTQIADRASSLRAAYEDPTPAVIGLLDDLTEEERADDPELSEVHRNALAMLAELSTSAAVRYLFDWIEHIDRVEPFRWRETSQGLAALRRARSAVVVEVAIERWASLSIRVREAVASLLGRAGVRDGRIFELLLVWLGEVWSGDQWEQKQYALWSVEEYGDPKAAPALVRLLDEALEQGTLGVAEELIAVLGRLGSDPAPRQRQRYDELAKGRGR